MRKGSSVKKIFLTLKSDKFNDNLINAEIEQIRKEENIEYKLIDVFSRKKKLARYDINWDQTNRKIYIKTLNKLLSNGFNINTCTNFLKSI